MNVYVAFIEFRLSTFGCQNFLYVVDFLRVDFSPGRPVTILPGQYVDLWMPSLNPWSCQKLACSLICQLKETFIVPTLRCLSSAFITRFYGLKQYNNQLIVVERQNNQLVE